MKNAYYTFREARDEKELIQLLRLRYKGYQNSQLKGFCPENKFKIDLDKFDHHAHHFGLFKVELNSEKPIGYMRIVKEEEGPFASEVKNIASINFPEVLTQMEKMTKGMLPAISYFPNGVEVVKLKLDHQKYNEGSRFVIAEEYRSFQLSKFMFECAIAFSFLVDNSDGAIICCSERHARFYKRFGFKTVPGTKVCSGIEGKFIKSSLLLLLLLDDIPKYLLSYLKAMGCVFNNYGSINFYPRKKDYFTPTQPVQLKLNQGKLIYAA